VEQDGQLIARYQYDPFGRRISKTLGAGQGAQTTWFIYSEEGLLAEVDTLGKTVRTYGWQPGTDWGTEPLWQADHASAQNSSSRTYHYLHNDHLSTPQVASDATGRSTWQALSESFGHTLERSGNRTRMNLRFAGQYFDEETGTHYNQQRDYAPGLGRYIQRDPIGLSGGINVYGYGYGNPLAYADPNGLVPLVLTPCVTSPQAAMGCAALAWGAANAAANACSNAVDAIKDWMSSDGGGDEGNKFPDRELPKDPRKKLQ
jgi:RHS repeat-associated protein